MENLNLFQKIKTMYESLKTNLQQWINCSDEELALFLKIVEPQVNSYKRKAFVLMEGEVSKNLYFINKGCLRYFYYVDGEEKTGQFFFENGWYTDMESFITQKPSRQCIQALEPTELLAIPQKKLYQAYEQVPIFERFGRRIIEQSFLGLRAKNENLVNLSPEEHYIKIIKERPKVIQRVSLLHIATYLGIKPESLSRIRKRLFNNKTNS